MKHLGRVRIAKWLIIALILATTLASSVTLWERVSLAQETPSAPAADEAGEDPNSGAGTNTTGDNTTGESTAQTLNDTQVVKWLLWTMVGLLLLYVIYLTIVQLSYYRTAERLGYAGIATEPTLVRTTQVLTDVVLNSDGTPTTTARYLTIKGPSSAVVHRASTKFTATIDEKPAENVVWSVSPTNAAAINPSQGSEMTITPARVGILKVTAKMDGNESTPIEVSAYREVNSKAVSIKLPFVGEGYVAFAALLIIVPAALMLSLTKIISGDAVIGLLSAALGFAFGGAIKTGGGTGTNTQNPPGTTSPDTPDSDS